MHEEHESVRHVLKGSEERQCGRRSFGLWPRHRGQADRATDDPAAPIRDTEQEARSLGDEPLAFVTEAKRTGQDGPSALKLKLPNDVTAGIELAILVAAHIDALP